MVFGWFLDLDSIMMKKSYLAEMLIGMVPDVSHMLAILMVYVRLYQRLINIQENFILLLYHLISKAFRHVLWIVTMLLYG